MSIKLMKQHWLSDKTSQNRSIVVDEAEMGKKNAFDSVVGNREFPSAAYPLEKVPHQAEIGGSDKDHMHSPSGASRAPFLAGILLPPPPPKISKFPATSAKIEKSTPLQAPNQTKSKLVIKWKQTKSNLGSDTGAQLTKPSNVKLPFEDIDEPETKSSLQKPIKTIGGSFLSSETSTASELCRPPAEASELANCQTNLSVAPAKVDEISVQSAAKAAIPSLPKVGLVTGSQIHTKPSDNSANESSQCISSTTTHLENICLPAGVKVDSDIKFKIDVSESEDETSDSESNDSSSDSTTGSEISSEMDMQAISSESESEIDYFEMQKNVHSLFSESKLRKDIFKMEKDVSPIFTESELKKDGPESEEHVRPSITESESKTNQFEMDMDSQLASSVSESSKICCEVDMDVQSVCIGSKTEENFHEMDMDLQPKSNDSEINNGCIEMDIDVQPVCTESESEIKYFEMDVDSQPKSTDSESKENCIEMDMDLQPKSIDSESNQSFVEMNTNVQTLFTDSESGKNSLEIDTNSQPKSFELESNENFVDMEMRPASVESISCEISADLKPESVKSESSEASKHSESHQLNLEPNLQNKSVQSEESNESVSTYDSKKQSFHEDSQNSMATNSQSPNAELKPNPFVQVDENVILCDENLIKEAKVVRCFCEPTDEEIAMGRGCGSGCINRELFTECGSRCPSGPGCSNRRFQNKQYAKVETFDAGIKGMGLRAVERLEPGNLIIEYVGEVIDAEEMARRSRRYGKDPKHVHHYLMALKNGAVIDATAYGNVSRFINHSCDPNCESQKWSVNRQLRIGFFAIKPILPGEEIVFDYQLLRYGRKAQRCFCGAANCRGRIGEDSDSEQEENLSAYEESEEEEKSIDVQITKPRKQIKTVRKVRRKQNLTELYNHAISNTLSRGPPRNRSQVRDIIQLMVQVEEAPQRSSLLQCIRFAHPDVLKIFMQECGLKLLYLILATDYPIDDQKSILQLQIKALDLLNVMPIRTRNQVNDSHLGTTVEKIAEEKGPIDCIVEHVTNEMINIVCCDTPCTSESVSIQVEKFDEEVEFLHCEMIDKAIRLVEKWKSLGEEYRIPRRERSDTPLSDDVTVGNRTILRLENEEKNRKRSIVADKNGSSVIWRLNGFGPPPKKRFENRGVAPPEILPSPIVVTDLTQMFGNEWKQPSFIGPANLPLPNEISNLPLPNEVGSQPKKRKSRFDVIGEHNPSSMYEVYIEDGEDPYAPPPPTLLPESMFANGLPDHLRPNPNSYQQTPLPELLDWNAVYASYDPSSADYRQFIDYYQQQQYPLVPAHPPPPSRPPAPVVEPSPKTMSILDAPSPPAEPKPTSPKPSENMLMIGPINADNPTDEQIKLLEDHLATLKARRAEIKKLESEVENKDKEIPPPPPAVVDPKKSLWVQATTEEGATYYYNKETRESSWTIPDESEAGGVSADTTTDRSDSRASFKAAVAKHVAGILEPIRKNKFLSADDFKYVLRKLVHGILEKELKRIGEADLRVTDSVKEKAKKYVADYIARLGDGCYSRKNKSHNSY